LKPAAQYWCDPLGEVPVECGTTDLDHGQTRQIACGPLSFPDPPL
jgi:hypothetical protein